MLTKQMAINRSLTVQ